MYVTERFKLAPRVKQDLQNRKPNFGYGIYGEIIFYLRYSRIKEDGSNENWADVVIRVIEGVMSIRKDWYIKNNIYWDNYYWSEYAERMANSMYNMEWMPPGRGLWAMGTDFVYERGSMALQNCAFTNVDNDIGADAHWVMDALMCGVGVGFNPIREDIMLASNPNSTLVKVVIEDSREGWCDSVKTLIDHFIYGTDKPEFDYSKIRPAGLLIKGFGGYSSGPEPLKILHKQIEDYFTAYKNGFMEYNGNKFTYDIVMLKTDIINSIGCCVIAGNVRRSAEIACGEIYDETFLNLKNYTKYPYREYIGGMSNNSVYLRESEDFSKLNEIAERVINNGEPGVINYRNLKYGRIGKVKDNLRPENAEGFNPCLSGDVKVYTADGRGYVPIKELADIGEDLDVFCVDANDEIVIRRMRHPRITGEDVPVYRVTFDNGDTIDVTGNHKFMMRNGDYKETCNLEYGDQLAVVQRYVDLNKSEDSYWADYIQINYKSKASLEHRLIAKANLNEDVHHKDLNKKNNNLNNLEIINSTLHQRLHSSGDLNPNYSGWTDEYFYEKGIDLCLKFNRRFSRDEWQAQGYPQTDSYFRAKTLGSFSDFSYECALRAGILNIDTDPRILRTLIKLQETGYTTKLINNKIIVIKQCKVCKCNFEIDYLRREQATCGFSCANTLRDHTKANDTKRKTFAKKKETLKEQQLNIYTELKLKLGRIPQRQEWKEECKAQGISSEIGRKSSPFLNYSYLRQAALQHNHRVISVEYLGKQTVYNGTVDDFHNFIVGGWQHKTKNNSTVERGVINPQCGEQPLANKECCTLVETVPKRCKDQQTWLKACEYAALYAQTVTLLPSHRSETNKIMQRNRRIGVGIIAYTEWVDMYGQCEVVKYLREGYETVVKYANFFADDSGVPHPIRYTTMKPGGTVPKIVGGISGAQYANFNYMIRRIRQAKTSPLTKLLLDAGIPYEPSPFDSNTLVFELPLAQPGRKAADVSLYEQAANIINLQAEWSDNAVSNTLNFKPKWPLIHRYEYKDSIELNTLLTKLTEDYKIDFVTPLNYKDKYEFNGYRAELKVEYGCPVLNVYKYDPTHEEDVIERVLTFAVPRTKSLSLLPHSSKGAYVQMPEEEISEEEYYERLNKLNNIDWSLLKGLKAENTDKFCTSDVCEINNDK